MRPLFVLVYMQGEQENQPFEHAASATPPRGLFSRIIKRLGLEKELALVKANLKFFGTLLAVFLVLSIFAAIGIKHVLAESSFGSYISLAFSDPSIVVKYWHSFMFAAFESTPGMTATVLLFSVAFLLLFIRLAAFSIEKLSIITKSINKQKYGYK